MPVREWDSFNPRSFALERRYVVDGNVVGSHVKYEGEGKKENRDCGSSSINTAGLGQVASNRVIRVASFTGVSLSKDLVRCVGIDSSLRHRLAHQSPHEVTLRLLLIVCRGALVS